MPKVPKWMANAMQSLFSGLYHRVIVTEVTDFTKGLRKIRFEGDFSKLKKEFIPGNVIEFRVSDTEFRHYTPSYFNLKEGICEIFFYLHDQGPGSKWVENLKNGVSLHLLGPGGKIKYSAGLKTHIAFGDETSLGSFICLKNETEKRGDLFLGIAELDIEHQNWTDLLHLDVFTVPKKEDQSAAEAILKIEELLKEGLNKNETAFYLTGNAKSISVVRKFLRQNGFASKNIQTEPYWAKNKQGL